MLERARPCFLGDILAIALPDLTATTRLSPPSGEARARLWPAGSALLIHALVLAVMVRLVAAPFVSPPSPQAIAVMLTPIAPLGTRTLQASTAQPPRLGAIPPLALSFAPVRADGHEAGAVARAAVTPGRTHAAALPAAAAAMPQPRAVAPPPIDADTLLPALESRIDAAVQRAAVLPASAQRQRREGRTRLRFTYQDGAVGDVHVIASSTSRVLDEAALAAVREANVPPVPAPLRGRKLDLLVWVNFQLSAG